VVENHFRSQVEIVEVPNPGNERKSDLGQSDIPRRPNPKETARLHDTIYYQQHK
jgi:hypothetical protein